MRLLAAGLAALAATGAPAHARPALELGVQDDPVFVRDPGAYGGRDLGGLLPIGRALDLTVGLGASVVRMNLPWAAVAPAPRSPVAPADPTALNLGRYDRAIDAARARGLAVQLTLDGPAPAWATADHVLGAFEPSPDAFAAFAATVAQRLRGRVGRYAIWNEPNWPGYLAPLPRAPQLYRELYAAASRALRRTVAGVQVLFGELAPMGAPEPSMPPLRFLRAALCRDRRLRAVRHCPALLADGVALHPYTLRWPPEYAGRRDDATTGSLRRLRRLLRRLATRHALVAPGGGVPGLYLTEWAFHARSRRMPEPLRSAYIVRALDRMLATPGVREVVWYQLAGPPASRSPLWDSALVTRRGVPRPAYRAIRRWARRARTGGRLASRGQPAR